MGLAGACHPSDPSAGASVKVILSLHQPNRATKAPPSPRAVINFTRSSPAHQGSWTMALTCAERICFITAARPPRMLLRTHRTCQTIYEIVVEGFASMPAHMSPSAASHTLPCRTSWNLLLLQNKQCRILVMFGSLLLV